MSPPRSHHGEHWPSKLLGSFLHLLRASVSVKVVWTFYHLPWGTWRWFPQAGRNESQGSSPLSRNSCLPLCAQQLPEQPTIALLSSSDSHQNLFTRSRCQWLNPKLTYQKLSLLWLNCSKSRQGKEWNNPPFPSINHLHNYLSSSNARGRGMSHSACHYSPNSGLFAGDGGRYKVKALLRNSPEASSSHQGKRGEVTEVAMSPRTQLVGQPWSWKQ